MIMPTSIDIIRPGILSSIQDAGRPGYRSVGVPVSGALDTVALALLNALLENAPGTAALEMLYGGVTLILRGGPARCALACTSGRVRTPDGHETGIAAWRTFVLQDGDRLTIASPRGTSTAYLAFEGGLDIAPVMNSLSTCIAGGFGGHEGRMLRAGDSLPLHRQTAISCMHASQYDAVVLPQPDCLRVIAGPQDAWFDAATWETFVGSSYVVTPESNRAGLRMQGPSLTSSRGHDLLSEGVATGSVQVTGSGKPVLLIGDHPTVGGYPRIATVIAADIAAAGRLRIGSTVRFSPTTLDEADHAREQLHATMMGIIAGRRDV